METEPIPNQDEDFDGDFWDTHPEVITFLISQGMTITEWMDLMTPVWQAQVKLMKEQGWLKD